MDAALPLVGVLLALLVAGAATAKTGGGKRGAQPQPQRQPPPPPRTAPRSSGSSSPRPTPTTTTTTTTTKTVEELPPPAAVNTKDQLAARSSDELLACILRDRRNDGSTFPDVRALLLRPNGFARMEARDSAGATPLLYTLLIKRTALVRAILTCADFPEELRRKWLVEMYHLPGNASIYEGENLLHIAVAHKDEEMVRFLLTLFGPAERATLLQARATGTFFRPSDEEWANASAATLVRTPERLYFGEYPLAFAVCTNQPRLVRVLVSEFGAPLDVADSLGNTLLHMAVMHQVPDAYDTVLELSGARFDAVDGMVQAAASAAPPLWKQKNRAGMTPLCVSARLGLRDMFRKQMLSQRIFHWSYASITSYAYDLEELVAPDGVVTQIIANEHIELVQEPLIEYLLKQQWDAGLGKLFQSRLQRSAALVLVLTLTAMLRFSHPRVLVWFPPLFAARGSSPALSEQDMWTSEDVAAWLVFAVGNSIVSWVAVSKFRTEFHEATRHGWEYVAGTRTEVFENVTSMLWTSAALVMLSLRHAPWVLVWAAPLVGWTDSETVDSVALAVAEAEPFFAASATFWAWMYCLFFLLGSENSGQFVLTLWRMLSSDVLIFSSVFAVILMAFSSAIFLLSAGATATASASVAKPSLELSAFMRRVEHGFSTLLGEYEPLPIAPNVYASVATMLYLAFTVLTTVLLLNVLIARMANTFDDIAKESRALWLVERARIMSSLLDEVDGGIDELVANGVVKRYWVEISGRKFLEVREEAPEYYSYGVASEKPERRLSVATPPPPPVPVVSVGATGGSGVGVGVEVGAGAERGGSDATGMAAQPPSMVLVSDDMGFHKPGPAPPTSPGGASTSFRGGPLSLLGFVRRRNKGGAAAAS